MSNLSKQQLVDMTIVKIKRDIEYGDDTALDELLKLTDRKFLIGFMSANGNEDLKQLYKELCQ